MSPRPTLRVIAGGCSWEWVSPEVQAEALALLDASPDPNARFELVALIEKTERGELKARKDYKSVASRPDVQELRIDSTRPRLRLYFGEGLRDGRAVAIGLLIAEKPDGPVAQQRSAQNADIALASDRFKGWNP